MAHDRANPRDCATSMHSAKAVMNTKYASAVRFRPTHQYVTVAYRHGMTSVLTVSEAVLATKMAADGTSPWRSP